MSATSNPAASLQAKLGPFLETLEPDELELLASVVERALDGEVEMFAMQPPQNPATPPGVPIPYPNTAAMSSSIAQVLNGIGQAINTSARKQ